MYVAATVPYLILIAMLVRGLLLPGAVEGIKYYSIPQWTKLMDAKVSCVSGTTFAVLSVNKY